MSLTAEERRILRQLEGNPGRCHPARGDRAVSRHVCIGEDCPRCQRLIDEREVGEEASPTGWRSGQDAYERHLDQMGGSA